ncbi:MAG: glycogen/starch synthase [Candidatus Kerfeldbacteria bacterium]
MKVLFVASEVAPYAKIGGVADVIGALPIELKNLGIDVGIIIPRYEKLTETPALEVLLHDVEVHVSKTERCTVYRGTLPHSDIPVYFIENIQHLSRGPIYNEHGDVNPFSEMTRFLFFSAAVTSALPLLGWKPHVIHCHDWHTAVVPALLKASGNHDASTLLTIHNIAHQGVWNAHDVAAFLGTMDENGSLTKHRDRHGDFNALQQGILAATMINTVSPGYAKEILTPEFGEELDTTLAERKDRISGILNGIDEKFFDPETDPALRVQYNARHIEKKIENKLALEEQCGFSTDRGNPVFGFIGRLADQKGIELILDNCKAFARAKARVVLLGTGLPDIEQRIRSIVKKYPETFYARIGFDGEFAQHIYAGSDCILVPSKFEPCGLVQLIAMRYGTPTVVRATGGLKDSVIDVSDHKRGLGFVFDDFSPKALWSAVERAISLYRKPDEWRALMVRCMKQNFSWERSAREYLSLYERCLTTV